MNTMELNNTDKAIYNHVKQDNHYYVSHGINNFYKDIEDEDFPLPSSESLFNLATYVGQEKKEQKPFVKYLKHLEHYGAHISNMTYTDPQTIHCQSFSNHTINLFDLAISTMNRPLIDYCLKNVMLPHFDEKTLHHPQHPLVSVLEHGEFYLLPLYEKQGLCKLPSSFYQSYNDYQEKYGEVSLLHYVAGDIDRILNEPEVRQRAIERLTRLKDEFAHLLPEMCDYDLNYIKHAQESFAQSKYQFSKDEQVSIKEFFDTVDHFFDLPSTSYDTANNNSIKKQKIHI